MAVPNNVKLVPPSPCTSLPSGPRFQPYLWGPKPTRAGSGQKQIQRNSLAFPSTFPRGFFISTTSSGPNTCLLEGPYLIGMCPVLVLGAIRGIRESLVATFVLTDVWFLSSVRSQVCFQVFESRVGLCATFKLRRKQVNLDDRSERVLYIINKHLENRIVKKKKFTTATKSTGCYSNCNVPWTQMYITS